MSNVFAFLAQTKPTAWSQLSQFLPFILVMVVFLVFMSRSKSKQEKRRQTMLSALKKGDRIQTIGGTLGTVVEVRDDEVVIKVDESNNTKIHYMRSAIHRVVEADKAEKPQSK